jgi:hypothetical protein
MTLEDRIASTVPVSRISRWACEGSAAEATIVDAAGDPVLLGMARSQDAIATADTAAVTRSASFRTKPPL